MGVTADRIKDLKERQQRLLEMGGQKAVAKHIDEPLELLFEVKPINSPDTVSENARRCRRASDP